MSEDFTSISAEEAEARIVAICAEDPTKLDLVTAEPDDFLSLKWRVCFEALRELREEFGDGVDPLIVFDRVKDLAHGIQLSDLVNLEASPVMIERYSDVVREEASKRRLRLGLHRALNMLKEGSSANEALSQASQAITEATLGQPDAAKTVGRVVGDRYLELSQMAQDQSDGKPCVVGITTGHEGLDGVLGGLQRGIPTLLAARPGMGKSALALNISNAASLAGVGVHIFSLEDTASNYADRVLSMGSGVNSRKIRAMDLTRGELMLVQEAGEKAKKRKGWIVDDRSGVTASEIVRCVRRSAIKNKTELVIVDYIQLLRGLRGQGTREMLSDAINCFGDAAKKDRMAYLVLSQLNRGLESRDDKRPVESDLKECGTLEERAKSIVMLYRPEKYGDLYHKGQYAGKQVRGQVVGQPIPAHVIEMIVRKNSNGETGTVMGTWQPEKMRIT